MTISHPIADHIRSLNKRAKTITNEGVKCKIPNSHTKASEIERMSKLVSERAARVQLLSHSRREEVKKTPLADACRRVAFGQRPKPNDIRLLARSWEAPAADKLLGMERRRIDKTEERLIKLIVMGKTELNDVIDYIRYIATPEEIMKVIDQAKEDQ